MISLFRLTLAAGLMIAASANAAEPAPHGAFVGCSAPPPLMTIRPAEARAAARIRQHEPLTIVAVGSSSTSGVGASAAELSYPSRLEAALRDEFSGIDIRVINRGRGGEDVSEELARLDNDVISEHPALVIWQVGTNAVLRRDDLAADGELIERGVAKLKANDTDVLLMDLQYAPRVLARPAYAAMEHLIATVAEHDKVGLFPRFDLMRHWQSVEPAGAPPMIGADGLHMTDRGYGCLADELAKGLAQNWRAQQRAVSPGQVAGLARPGRVAAPPADAGP